MGLIYFVAQLMGAFAGYSLLRCLVPFELVIDNDFCITAPSERIDNHTAFLIEFMLTAAFVLISSGIWNSKHHESAAIKIGLTVFLLGLVGVC